MMADQYILGESFSRIPLGSRHGLCKTSTGTSESTQDHRPSFLFTDSAVPLALDYKTPPSSSTPHPIPSAIAS